MHLNTINLSNISLAKKEGDETLLNYLKKSSPELTLNVLSNIIAESSSGKSSADWDFKKLQNAIKSPKNEAINRDCDKCNNLRYVKL